MENPQAALASAPPLLATKLHAPRWRAGLVSRPRLIAALDRGANGRGKLTLISAPAGFGKSTLLAEWLAVPTGERAAAWVSLDQGDNDPALFWSYVMTAVQTQRPEIGGQALALLRSPQPPPVESVLTLLINELAALPGEMVLILDDLHVIEGRPIHDALAFLLDHLPPRLRLVITTRADPPLPVARLRGRGELTELRAADLRFTAEEAAAFLNEVMGLGLTADDVAALETRAEGWIAGLQLAALSMRGHDDIPSFIKTFTGDHRYIVDYLVEEVLQRQPERVSDFLLQTSILDRLSGPLCDAVTGQEGGSARLEALERGNFFLIPLDNRRHWYRYHHLFADVLHARLLAEHPEQAATLHCRASAWHEQQGAAADAIRHALAGEDFARAAGLIERTATVMRQRRQEATLLGWISALPDETLRNRPVLSAVYAGILLQTDRFDDVETHLRNAERWLEQSATGELASPESLAAEMVVVDEDEFRRLPASIAVHRAGRALAEGDVADAAHLARRALDIIPDDDHLYRGAATAILGLASWAGGELETAYQSYAEGMASLQRAGNAVDVIGGKIALADIRITQGRLHDAMRIYQQAVQQAAEQGAPAMRGTADMYVGMSAILREHNDLDAAAQHLKKSAELGEIAGFPQNPYRWRVAMARLREAHGDFDGALALLDEAERRYVSDFYPNVRPIPATKARVWVRQDQLGDALAWTRERGLSAEDELSYLREFEHITLARLMLAQSQPVVGFLERLLIAAESGERTGSVIEILVLQALAYQQQDDIATALMPLERALGIAEPEGYARIFIDEGEPMRRLLRDAASSGATNAYAQQLLRAFGEPPASASVQAQISATALPEPLTAREIEILRLIAAGMRNQEIADQLFISLPTVKRHVANAYGKLGVTHRTEAIARANELKVL
jgi:LuxR family maltose regulon positive regulatory protein